MVIRECAMVIALLALTGAAFAQDGKSIFIRCQGCHTIIEKPAVVRRGPNLYDLFGRKPGSLADYEYSEAMVAFGQDKVWDKTTLTNFLHSPPTVVPGTKMELSGIRSDEEIDALLGYMATFDPGGMSTK